MEHGKVTSVTYEDGVVYCDINPNRVSNQYTDIPVLNTHSGFVEVPEQSETVAIQELEDGTRFVTNVISKEKSTPDSMKEGEIAFQLDDDTLVRFEKMGNGTHNLTISASNDLTVEGKNISISAEETLAMSAETEVTVQTDNASIDANQKIDLTAPSGVFLNGQRFDKHTHDYDDDGTTKTTDSPN